MQDVSNTRYGKDIRWLRRNSFLILLVSIMIVAFGLIAISAYFKPGLNQGRIPFLLVGIGFPLFGLICITYTLWWSRRVLRIFKNAEAKQMWVTIEASYSSDSTTYYACLTKDENKEEYLWKLAIKGPDQAVKELLSKQVKKVPGKQQMPAKVYVDPKTGKPLVIETQIGLLWLY